MGGTLPIEPYQGNASDYVRDLIRRDQEYQDRCETLIKAFIVGEKSGGSARGLEGIWQSVKDRYGLDMQTVCGECRG